MVRIPEISPPTLEWIGDETGSLQLIDQTLLPRTLKVLDIQDCATLIDAIQRLAIRGAPALGVAAAYGAALAAREAATPQEWDQALQALRASRPTAVNLFFALARAEDIARREREKGWDPQRLLRLLLDEARNMHRQDQELCLAMGRHGAELLRDGMRILTHCNTGRFATAGIGTAFGVLVTAHAQGKDLFVYADETRPLLQGARLTAFELEERGIPGALLCDGAGPGLILSGEVDAILVGADRIAANGDTANKVGTLPLALAARHAGLPFYIVAPTTTLDPETREGREIVIEERDPREVTLGPEEGRCPPGFPARNPAFDVTPAELITALVTEKGVASPPFSSRIQDWAAE
ncbi:MAG TPA: S-methyl-5-thioribose-1-phosphate isomerase [Planctomycetes bacterium]|nr:S-methyl-5-thioribose-1-phosphate isomerase [Planctomycetota bacterium]